MQLLEQDVKYLKGVGPRRAELLGAELGVRTVGDLLRELPYKYIDRSEVHKICDLQDEMPYVQLRGKIVDFVEEGTGRKQRIRAVFTDGTGYVELIWFAGLRYVRETYKVEREYLLLGKPALWNGRFSISHPELDKIEPGQEPQQLGLQPLYHTSERMKKAGVSSRTMTQLVRTAFDAVGAQALPETLPAYLQEKHRLCSLTDALRTAHFPPSAAALPAAMRRLKFEELFFLQLDILRYALGRQQKVRGLRFVRVGNMFNRFYHERLPFELTGAQKRVVREIRRDTGSGAQMNRLLQGDVGSGKTMVAMMACLLAVDNGYQACLMAPTEILAEQHLATLREQLGNLPVRVELLTGIVKGRARREVLEGVADGTVQILVGTHALIEPTVRFANLGLAVIDEQHRFGVKQRAALWNKNARPPHILVMTATPIPRTLAMTVYGDLDVSVIDELPPGRKPIRTIHYYENQTVKLFEGIRYQLSLGRQIYVIYPLIKESEKLSVQFVEQGYADVQKALPQYRVGMVHGQMRPQDKEAAMQAFKRGETHILVSTTVIEVGVNVPNASVMVIQNAERFGLAQLHQLRGRVGRGSEQSYCVLVTKRELSEDTRRRMQIMVETTDGFEIAEEDMKLRGPGDLEGTQQSGMPFDLKVANVVRDADLMVEARHAAAAVLQADPEQALPQNAPLWQRLDELKTDRKNFSAIS